jgi:plasmid stabilization system protein ParE
MPEKKLLEWSPQSERNVRRIHAYIATDNPQAAQDVVDEIVISAAGLRNFPLIGKLSDGGSARVGAIKISIHPDLSSIAR